MQKLRRTGFGLVALFMSVGLLAACGSSSGSPKASSAVKATCLQVGAALADGPDPDADPIGYAEAQILPLAQIHTTDKSLQTDIHNLDSAYKSFYDTNGASAAKTAVSQASKKIDAICPGVTS